MVNAFDGDDIIDGGAGVDILRGGNGADRYIIDNAADVIDESTATTYDEDTVLSYISFNLANTGVVKGFVENVQLLGTANLNILGNTLDNRLIGNSGNNEINGGYGVDLMQGRGGNDVYTVDNPFDIVDESLGGSNGLDTVRSTISFSLADAQHARGAIERLILLGTDNLNATGNSFNNLITGNSGRNVIDGGLGADTMRGGVGSDQYYVDNVGDVVDETGGGEGTGSDRDTVLGSISIDLSDTSHFIGGIEGVELIGTASVNATGNDLDNFLFGNAGNNTLDGGLGADQMRGGNGDDIYIVNDLGDDAEERDAQGNISGGIDLILSSVNRYGLLEYYIENLTLLGTQDLTATGNQRSNVLTGNSGNNILWDGDGGTDILRGMAGNDTYHVTSAGDIVDESVAGSNGVDTVITTEASFNLGTQTLGLVENITLIGTSGQQGLAIGNGLANVIIGNSARNLIAGGFGSDTLTGGGGDDIFLFNTAPNPATNRDQIMDMNGSGNDTIQLDDAVYTALAIGNLTASAFVISSTGATDADDRIIYNSDNGQLIYDSNGNAAGGSVLFAVVAQGLALTAADFVVV